MEIEFLSLNIYFKDNKTHIVRVYKYIKGETMNNIKFNHEISADFGSYVGNLTSILKVNILNLLINIILVIVSYSFKIYSYTKK